MRISDAIAMLLNKETFFDFSIFLLLVNSVTGKFMYNGESMVTEDSGTSTLS